MTYRANPHRSPWPKFPWIVVFLTMILSGAVYLHSRFFSPDPTIYHGTPSQPLHSINHSHHDAFTRGVGLGLYSRDVSYDYGPMIAEIAEHHANSVSLFFTMYQKDAHSVKIAPIETVAQQEQRVLRATEQAQALGLDVLHFPVVLLSRPNPGQWRGKLDPDDLDAWFEQYRSHLLRLARLSQASGASGLCVGSEFSSLEQYEDFWRNLIKDIRQIYSGQIIYSANWDHYQDLPFWDALDAVGLSGYYELTTDQNASLEALTSAWARERNRILAWKRSNAIAAPLLFTEIGYPNIDGAAIHPWDYTRTGSPDPEEQARCYQAFVDVWRALPDLSGVYFYNWFGYSELDAPGYSPRGKPAADVMKAWFSEVRTVRQAP